MPKNKIGEDSPIPKFIYLKIRCRDGVESLTTLEEGEFKVPIDGCISTPFSSFWKSWSQKLELSRPGGGGTHMLRHTGMCHPNGLLFHQKSVDMVPILVKKILRRVPFHKVCNKCKISHFWGKQPPGGGTDLERGYGDVRPWRPPFHASPAARKGPISSKRVSSQDPLLRKFGNFSLYSRNFHPNLVHKPPNLEIFSSQAPKFGNFPLTSPPFSEANVSSQAPHFGNPGRTPLPEKRLSAPPPGKQPP